MNSNNLKGIGLGLRFEHLDSILTKKPDTPWFEVILEDFLVLGPHHKNLLEIRKNYPIAFHSIGLNLGGVDDYDLKYLTKIKNLYDIFRPEIISDHICWSHINGLYHHDLLPIPKTFDGLENISKRVNFLQDFFKRQLVLENITSYIDYKNESFSELEFIKELVKKTGCGLILDITNIVINHKNRKTPYDDYFQDFPYKAVKQIHLSGYTKNGDQLIDSHNSEVSKEDLNILKKILGTYGAIPAMIERDTNIPSFESLNDERRSIEEYLSEL